MMKVYCIFRQDEHSGMVSYKLMKIYQYESLAKARIAEYTKDDELNLYYYETWYVQD